MKKDNIIKDAMILFAITLIAGLLLGLTSEITADARALQAENRITNALEAVFEGGVPTNLDLDADYEGYVTALYQFTASEGSSDIIGYAFQLETTEGYGDILKMMIGMSTEGTITGFDVISHTETPGLGAKSDEDEFKNQFIDKTFSTLIRVKGNSDGQNIDAIGGATITSDAVVNAVNGAVDYYDTYVKGAN